MSRHTISHADEIFAGSAFAGGLNQSQRGIKLSFLHQQHWGVDGVSGPIVADADGIIDGAVTPAAGASITLNGVLAGGPFDYARGVQVVSSGADSTQAVIITGTDIAGNPQTESIDVTTTTPAFGLKAFLTITNVTVDITLGFNLDVGTSDVLGLPVRCLKLSDMLTSVDEAGTADTGTLVVADVTSPVTTTTGDARGTFDPSTTLNGTKEVIVHYVADLSKEGYGVDSAG